MIMSVSPSSHGYLCRLLGLTTTEHGPNLSDR
jgi:hypothetical protein